MKNFLRLLILTISVLLVSVPVFANTYETMPILGAYNPIAETEMVNDSICVQLNGEVIDFTDSEGNKVEPQIINSRTMVPMRKIFEVLGANVEWIPETKSIKSNANGIEIGLQIDNAVATIKDANGEIIQIILDSAPTIVNNRTLVPVRFIAESLNKKVGWDAYNRTVIIIDTGFVEDVLKKDASNFYEYLTTDFEKINTCEMKVDLEGRVKYKDAENTKNNTSLNILGNMNMKLSENAMSMDLEVNFTGKGILIEELEKQELKKLKVKIMVDVENNVMYLKVDGVEDFGDKWIKTDLGEDGKEIKALLDMAKKQETVGMNAMIDMLLPEENLTVLSYEELTTTLQMLTTLMGNKNFKVSGRTDKTYTYTLDLTEILNMIMDAYAKENEAAEEEIKLNLGFEVKVKDRVAKTSKFEISALVELEEESAEIVIEADTNLVSYNKSVTINMPTSKDIATF